MGTDFEQLSNDTLAKIKEFGIKSKTVCYWHGQTCRMLKAYLEENNLIFSFENSQRWLSEIYPHEPIVKRQIKASNKIKIKTHENY
jgi:hypothetical protein